MIVFVGAIVAMLSSMPASMPAAEATLVTPVAKKATCQRPCRATLRAAYNACLAACAEEDKKKKTAKPNPNLRDLCVWVGTAPFCNGHCGPNTVEKARAGNVGGKVCVTGTRAYCCQKVLR